MSTETTFKELNKAEEQLSLCRELCEDLAEDMKKEDLKGKTVTLKLKNVNFEVKTRAVTLPFAVATVDEIYAAAKDLLKTEIENESPQPLRLRLMGVRISAFVSSDDKKPLQKSIIGFLQPGKTDSSQLETSCPLPMQTFQRQEEVPWRTKQMGIKGQTDEEPQMSFFQKAHAKRLQLQAASASTQEDVHVEKASAITSTDNHTHESVESSINGHKSKSNCTASGLSENDSVSLSEAHASTSGCGGTVSESLTCPVCFRQVETTDLNVFNRHIDQCLSDVSRKPNLITVSDSESDPVVENDHEECEVMDKWRGEFEVQNQQESNKLDPPQDQHNLINDSSQTVLLINGDNGPVNLQQPQSCNGKCPLLICPVCQLRQDTNDLTMFNRHVDLCLNREVLHELGGQTLSPVNPPSVAVTNTKVTDRGHPMPRQTSKGKTKRQDTPSSPPSKKTKGLGPRNTIDKFFR